MHDRQSSKNRKIFCDFDLSKVKKQDEPHILFFEEQNPIAVIKTDDLLQVFVNGCIIEIKNPTRLSHKQYIFLDLFSKGLYYKNLSNYKNLDSFIFSLRLRGNEGKKCLSDFVETFKKAIDGEIERIEITKNGEFITSSSQVDSTNE